jgi:hypothetical protein
MSLALERSKPKSWDVSLAVLSEPNHPFRTRRVQSSMNDVLKEKRGLDRIFDERHVEGKT